MADGSKRCEGDNAREEGGFAGRQYSPHRLQGLDGFHMRACDQIEIQCVAPENRRPSGLTHAQVTVAGEMTTVRSNDRRQMARNKREV